MDHVAILKKSWDLSALILTGKKTIESRWYTTRRTPWNRINPGDTIYFKNTGEPVTLKAEVDKTLQSSDLTSKKVAELLKKYGKDIGLQKEQIPSFAAKNKHKKYCILIFLKNPQKIKPFDINKTGFGNMTAWLTLEHVDKIRRKP